MKNKLGISNRVDRIFGKQFAHLTDYVQEIDFVENQAKERILETVANYNMGLINNSEFISQTLDLSVIAVDQREKIISAFKDQEERLGSGRHVDFLLGALAMKNCG